MSSPRDESFFILHILHRRWYKDSTFLNQRHHPPVRTAKQGAQATHQCGRHISQQDVVLRLSGSLLMEIGYKRQIARCYINLTSPMDLLELDEVNKPATLLNPLAPVH